MAAIDRTSGELAELRRLAGLLGTPPDGDVWAGDDAAVLHGGAGALLLTSDALVEGVHFTRAFSAMSDVGWKALAVSLSDVAAMGGSPRAAVVAVCGASSHDLEGLYEGLLEAGERYQCPIVGGDLSDGNALIITVSMLGTMDGRLPVLRSGGRPGDRLYVSGALGGSAAGLRALRTDVNAVGDLVDLHRRPLPRMVEGLAAAELGATAMLDLSDGLGVDVERLAQASGCGISLVAVPVRDGATADEALGGGEDYELLFSAPPQVDVIEGFTLRGLAAPFAIGELTVDPDERSLNGGELPPLGYLHDLQRPPS